MKIYSPEGRIGRGSVLSAAAPATLADLRVAVLDNGKPGARHILERIAERLGARTESRFVGHFRKRTAATPCAEELVEEVSGKADLVLTGIAD